jgi:F-type H+-transporting ATP synthase subunit e
LRWAALGAGVAYGAYHQSTLSAQAKVAQQQREYHHKQTLIEKAKEEYIKKTQPQKGDGGTFPRCSD